MSKKPVIKQDVTTTGHSWDGIEELNNPLPRWWLWTFYLTIIWGIGYVIAYPAWPLVHGATAGLLGYSTRAEVQADIDKVTAANASINNQLAGADLTTLAVNDPVHQFGVSQGAAVFRTFCAQCHGAGAAGAKGYPNLLDDDWLWGGDLQAIEQTVKFGVRAGIDETRQNDMPAWGEILEPEQIPQVVQYVMKISGQEFDAAQAALGEPLFNDNCVACHGEKGQGDRELGGPNLTDAIWLYGSDINTLTATITNGRKGVMPNWGARLSEAQVKAVTLYVHQLGGGE